MRYDDRSSVYTMHACVTASRTHTCGIAKLSGYSNFQVQGHHAITSAPLPTITGNDHAPLLRVQILKDVFESRWQIS